MKKRISLTERDLHHIIKKCINEAFDIDKWQEEIENRKNSPTGQLLTKLIKITNDQLPQEENEYGIKMTALKEFILDNEYQFSLRLYKNLLYFLYQRDIIAVSDEDAENIDIKNSDCQDVAKIMIKLKNLL